MLDRALCCNQSLKEVTGYQMYAAAESCVESGDGSSSRIVAGPEIPVSENPVSRELALGGELG